MKAFLRGTMSVVAGMAVAFVLALVVEVGSAVVHPFPADFRGTQQEVCDHVAKYPHWVLAVVVVAWSGLILASAWVAGRLAGRIPAGIVAALAYAVARKVGEARILGWSHTNPDWTVDEGLGSTKAVGGKKQRARGAAWTRSKGNVVTSIYRREVSQQSQTDHEKGLWVSQGQRNRNRLALQPRRHTPAETHPQILLRRLNCKGAI